MKDIRQRKGLTLIEMLVMLVVVAIFALVAIPEAQSLVQYYRIATAADKLYIDLEYARTESVKRNTNVYVSFTTGDSWCYGINTGSACNCSTPSGCNLGTNTAPSAGILTLSATGLTSGAIYFDGTHGNASSAATITYTLYGQTSLITTSISQLGNITTCSTGLSGYTAC